MFRRYNRMHSRFDQPDPDNGSYSTDNPQSLNRYAYTQSDPVNLVDPTGLHWELQNCHEDFEWRTADVKGGGYWEDAGEVCDLVWVPDGPFGGGGGEPGGGGGGSQPTTVPKQKKPKCKQDKSGGDRADIESKLNAAGLPVSGIQSAGRGSPEGIVGTVSNRQAALATLDASAAFRHRTPLGGIDHFSQVGGTKGDVILGNGNVLEYRSFTDKDGLGSDSSGFVRSLQVVIGPETQRGGAVLYADLDCENPDQDVWSFLKHNVPILARRLF